MAQAVNSLESQENQILDKMANHHIRVAVVGNVDSGKSTLIGCLVSGIMDNGRGEARARVTRHNHELISGRTSSIGSHLLGLDEFAETVVSSSDSAKITKAARLVSLIDMAGHEKYLKTTVAGISRGMADYALLLVDASQPPTHMTKHHLRLCVAMGIPVIVVMTMVDRCPSELFRSAKLEILTMLADRTIGLRAFTVSSKKDVDTVKDKVSARGLTPLISISCVTGEGLGALKALLKELPQRRCLAQKQRQKEFEFLIEDVFQVHGVGTVLSGIVTRGEWKKGEPLYIGPLKDGSIYQTTPKSVHVERTNVDHVYAGHSVCFALPKVPKYKRSNFTKGMVALRTTFVPTRTLTAEMYLLQGKNFTIARGQFQATLNILHNKLAANVVAIEDEHGVPIQITRNNERSTWVKIKFRLPYASAYLRSGMKVIMRDGYIRGFGGTVSVGD
jgi:elongation factor 1-alpha